MPPTEVISQAGFGQGGSTLCPNRRSRSGNSEPIPLAGQTLSAGLIALNTTAAVAPPSNSEAREPQLPPRHHAHDHGADCAYRPRLPSLAASESSSQALQKGDPNPAAGPCRVRFHGQPSPRGSITDFQVDDVGAGGEAEMSQRLFIHAELGARSTSAPAYPPPSNDECHSTLGHT